MKHKLEKVCWFCKQEIAAYQWNRLKLERQRQYLLIPVEGRTYKDIAVQPYHWNFSHDDCLEIANRELEQFATEIEATQKQQQHDQSATEKYKLRNFFELSAAEQAEFRNRLK